MENRIIPQETESFQKAIFKLNDEMYETFHHRLSNSYSEDEFDKLMWTMNKAALIIGNIY